MEPTNNNHLKELRRQRGYTQQDVADFLGVTKATISKYENGQRALNYEYIGKLAELFLVEPIYILTGETSEDWRRRLNSDEDAAEQEDRAYWESVLLPGQTKEIVALLDRLNDEGKQKAVERVTELTEIPRYQV